MRQLSQLIVMTLVLATTVIANAGDWKKIHDDAIVVDGHNDLPWTLRSKGIRLNAINLKEKQDSFHTDIPRLKKGGLGVQFWSAYVPANTEKNGTALLKTLEQIALIREMVNQYPDTFAMVQSSSDIKKIVGQGKIASMIGIEGGYSIEESIPMIKIYYDLGVRYMTLTHSKTTKWADSATDKEKHGGLNNFGKKVVKKMNEVDISHVSVKTMQDVLKVSQAPIIASHSSAYEILPHPRNIPDNVLKRIAKNRGVIYRFQLACPCSR